MAEVKPVDEVHSTGHIGGLDSDQKEKLKQIWKEFLDHTEDGGGKAAVAAANGLESSAKELPAKGGAENDTSNKAKAKEASKDDADKASANKAEEQRGLEELLHEHGPSKFHIAFWQYTMGEDPDALMCRFLRARSWDVKQAFAMLASTVKWRIDTNVEEIVAGGEEQLCKLPGAKKNLALAKCYYHGTDKQNRPVIYVRVKYHKASGQTADEMLKYIVLNMETARNLIPVGADFETSSVVFDMTGLSLGNVDWDIAPMVIKIFQSHYPETLGHAVVYNAPGIFSAVWKIVKPMLDPAVREKVHFASSASEMGKFIDPKHLEKDFGGTSSWRYRYKGPVAGENKDMEDKETKEKRVEAYAEAVTQWTEATQKWIKGDDAAFQERREKLRKLVRVRQLDLNPYVRGKVIATRDGTVVGDGTVLWHYDHGHNEEFGKSTDEWAKEVGVEDPPSRPRNKDEDDVVLSSAEDTVSSTSDSENEILDDPHHHHHNAVAVGFAKIGDNIGNTFSKIGKGPSLHEKRKKKREKKHEEHEARRAKKIELKKKRLEAEKAKEEEAEDARLEREEKEREEIENSYQAYLGRMANLGLTATNKAADYVPAVLGGNYIKSFTDTNGKQQTQEAAA